MNYLDIIIIVFAAVGAFFGWRKGFSVLVSFMLGSFCGMWAGSNYYRAPAKLISPLAQHPGISYFIVFVIVCALIILAGLLVHRIFRIVFLGLADRIAGLTAGIVVSVSFVGALLVPLELGKAAFIGRAMRGSMLAPAIAAATKKVITKVPPKRIKFFDVQL